MAATKRRSPTSTLVSKNAITQASSSLQDLPEKPKEIWSLREAINLLKDQITVALDRGYSYTEVSQMLSKTGVEISPSTLKYYLSSARKEDGGGKTKTRRRRRTLNLPAEALQNGMSDAAMEKAPAKAKTADDAKAPATKTAAKKPAAAKAPATKTAAKKPAVAKAPATKTAASRTRKKTAG
ncbi:hypothetical protein [Myxacorys almedinensis]|uniref:hypothetical protein n=1 Tax=Myxacorys almedinensis TaxID=2651157 RepID=UPI00192F0EB0|nr:hypothetical protein [Myxacorys almedinensis]